MKPILFNTEMDRATLEDRKTVTRRVVKPQPEITPIPTFGGIYRISMKENVFVKPPYRHGDILYVRETWGDYSECQPGGAGYYLYRADYPDGAKTDTSWDGVVYNLPRWHPSIHMPREAARIFLLVKDVRVERLQDITDDGIVRDFGFCAEALKIMNAQQKNVACMALWDSTIKPVDRVFCGWRANPWVWVIEFERCEKPKEAE